MCVVCVCVCVSVCPEINSNRDRTVFVLGVDMRNSMFRKIFDIVQSIPVV